MMVYLWARDPENHHIRMSFFGVLQFNAPYLPWVLLIFSLVLGNPVEMDVLGIIVGHTYYFLDFIYPQVAEIRGWSLKKIIVTPPILKYIFSPPLQDIRVVDNDVGFIHLNIYLFPNIPFTILLTTIRYYRSKIEMECNRTTTRTYTKIEAKSIISLSLSLTHSLTQHL
jgi:hypothetical protein